MDSDLLLTLPGTLPDLLRRGSPVIFFTEVKIAGFIFQVGCRAVVEEISSTGEPVIHGQVINPNDVGLDLSDLTGRYHARLWLGKRRPQLAVQDPEDILLCYLDLQTAQAKAAAGGPARLALAALDPYDNRRLPDGARRVEALGLQRLCLHIGNQHGALPARRTHG